MHKKVIEPSEMNDQGQKVSKEELVTIREEINKIENQIDQEADLASKESLQARLLFLEKQYVMLDHLCGQLFR